VPILFPLKDHFRENALYLNRTVIASTAVIFAFLILFSRLLYLQLIQHDLFTTLSKNNQVRIIPIVPKRGLIYDKNGILLAENIPAFSLEITPAKTKNISKTIEMLSQILEITEDNKTHFNKQLKYKSRHQGIPLKVKLTEEELAKFSLEKYRFPEAEIQAKLIRHYPHGSLFAHALGYVGLLNEKEFASVDQSNYQSTYHIGKTGIEKYYEKKIAWRYWLSTC